MVGRVMSSPRLWPNPPGNSPLPLPKGPSYFSRNDFLELLPPQMPEGESIDLDGLKNYIGKHTLPDGKMISEVINLENRRPLLIAGELANPYRLSDIMAPDMPIIPIRMEDICRTWADNLDGREIQPGIHHVTIVRSPGWWERSFITLLEIQDMKKMVQWLDGPNSNTWAPKRLAEGVIRLENDMELLSPEFEQISWDGKEEKVELSMPLANGPALDLSTLMVPINTRSGCYNSRGRVNRCVHYLQTDFHENMFRRGSSFKWADMLNFL
tara:strand:- start:1810 stop:2616 length:807 start_codon:yes stop_codon:yes gene_type:complete